MRSPLEGSLFAALLLMAALAVAQIGNAVSPQPPLRPLRGEAHSGLSGAEPAINWALLEQVRRR